MTTSRRLEGFSCPWEHMQVCFMTVSAARDLCGTLLCFLHGLLLVVGTGDFNHQLLDKLESFQSQLGNGSSKTTANLYIVPLSTANSCSRYTQLYSSQACLELEKAFQTSHTSHTITASLLRELHVIC